MSFKVDFMKNVSLTNKFVKDTSVKHWCVILLAGLISL